MKKWLWVVLFIAVAAIVFYGSRKTDYNLPKANQTNMEITSIAFKNGEPIPRKYTCQGENINPLLAIQDAPVETKSFALIMDDPDAPMGTFIHWVVWNIASDTNVIPENSVPQGGIQAPGSSGKRGYVGPCPPSGKHRYFFKLYALDAVLDLPVDVSLENMKPGIDKHILAEAELMGLYKKE